MRAFALRYAGAPPVSLRPPSATARTVAEGVAAPAVARAGLIASLLGRFDVGAPVCVVADALSPVGRDPVLLLAGHVGRRGTPSLAHPKPTFRCGGVY